MQQRWITFKRDVITNNRLFVFLARTNKEPEREIFCWDHLVVGGSVFFVRFEAEWFKFVSCTNFGR